MKCKICNPTLKGNGYCAEHSTGGTAYLESMKKKIKVNPPKLRKGQKCWSCKKEIKKDWCWNGHFWHGKCKDKDSVKIIKKYFPHIG